MGRLLRAPSPASGEKERYPRKRSHDDNDNDTVIYYEDRGESVTATEQPGAGRRGGVRGEADEPPRGAVIVVMAARSDSLRERCISASS